MGVVQTSSYSCSRVKIFLVIAITPNFYLPVLDESLEPIIVENSVHNQLLGANANDSAISTIVADQAADRYTFPDKNLS